MDNHSLLSKTDRPWLIECAEPCILVRTEPLTQNQPTPFPRVPLLQIVSPPRGGQTTEGWGFMGFQRQWPPGEGCLHALLARVDKQRILRIVALIHRRQTIPDLFVEGSDRGQRVDSSVSSLIASPSSPIMTNRSFFAVASPRMTVAPPGFGPPPINAGQLSGTGALEI